MDNLDRAERLALIASADDWFAVRKLRNQMVHECIENPTIPANALQTGHRFVPALREATDTMLSAMAERGWLS